MKIHLRFLRSSGTFPEILAKDGWSLEWERDGSLTVRHPLVDSESAGRSRLQTIGLLTTRSAHIEFDRHGERRPISV